VLSMSRAARRGSGSGTRTVGGRGVVSGRDAEGGERRHRCRRLVGTCVGAGEGGDFDEGGDCRTEGGGHGDGWVACCPRDFSGLCGRFAGNGAPTAMGVPGFIRVNTRAEPEHKVRAVAISGWLTCGL
jgi:hypothetical protein